MASSSRKPSSPSLPAAVTPRDPPSSHVAEADAVVSGTASPLRAMFLFSKNHAKPPPTPDQGCLSLIKKTSRVQQASTSLVRHVASIGEPFCPVAVPPAAVLDAASSPNDAVVVPSTAAPTKPSHPSIVGPPSTSRRPSTKRSRMPPAAKRSSSRRTATRRHPEKKKRQSTNKKLPGRTGKTDATKTNRTAVMTSVLHRWSRYLFDKPDEFKPPSEEDFQKWYGPWSTQCKARFRKTRLLDADREKVLGLGLRRRKNADI